jgi:hypothetical protein
VQLIESLVGAVARVAPDGAAWLESQLAFDRGRFAPAFSAAGRKLGKVSISEDDARQIPIPWPVTGADECGRAALVASALTALPGDEHVAFIRDLIRRGEVRERQAVLRVLAGLPEPARFVDLAVDAFRTNVQSVFEALACDNAYPSAYFSSAQFAQLVLKALFVGAPVGRIHALRVDGELVRMVEAYASERRAAGRPVPEDAKLILR